jgi:hypothetical protein
VDLEVRVSAALTAGLEDDTWRLLARNPRPLIAIGHLDVVLSTWAARELARLKLPAATGPVLVVANPEPPHLATDAVAALADTREALPTLPWPRWSGPVVIVVGAAGAADPAPGQDLLARPALPVIRYRPTNQETAREHLGARFCELSLRLTAPPAAGWPPWLSLGLAELVKARIRGEGPSPQKMLELRQQAGRDDLRRLLSEAAPDPRLALALCTPLAQTRRRHLLPNFLELLRNGAGAEGAIRVAYGLTLEQLLETP